MKKSPNFKQLVEQVEIRLSGIIAKEFKYGQYFTTAEARKAVKKHYRHIEGAYEAFCWAQAPMSRSADGKRRRYPWTMYDFSDRVMRWCDRLVDKGDLSQVSSTRNRLYRMEF